MSTKDHLADILETIAGKMRDSQHDKVKVSTMPMPEDVRALAVQIDGLVDAQNALVDQINGMEEQKHELGDRKWDMVAQAHGYKDLDDAHGKGFSFIADPTTGVLVLLRDKTKEEVAEAATISAAIPKPSLN